MHLVSFNVIYDSGSDVLYISTRKETAIRGIEDKHGIVWRYAANDELIGVTMIDFRSGWSNRQIELAREISFRFNISLQRAENLLEIKDDCAGQNSVI